MADPEIICCGMALVDVLVAGFKGLPKNSDIDYVSSVTFSTGGDAINQAMAATKLGSRVGLWAVLGDDAQGAYVREQCKAFNINGDGLTSDKKIPTTTSLVLIENSGERSFLTPRTGSIRQYAPKHINLDLIKPGLKVFSIGSLFCSPDFDLKALPRILCAAKSVGAITMADFIANERNYGIKDIAASLPLIDFLAPSEGEAQIYTAHKDPKKIVAAFRKLGAHNIVLKRGPKGVMAFKGDDVLELPAFKTKVVDTTGAGDNFMGGFAHGISQGMELEKALRLGLATAALSIQAVGAGAGLKDLKQVKAFLRAQK